MKGAIFGLDEERERGGRKEKAEVCVIEISTIETERVMGSYSI